MSQTTDMIPFRYAYKYLGGKEKYSTRSKRSSLNSRIKKLIKLGIVKGDESKKMVNIKSLERYYDYESNIIESYMTILDFHEQLGTNKDTTAAELKTILLDIAKQYSFEFIETCYPINKRKFFVSKWSVEQFFKKYVSMNYIKKHVNKSHGGWQKTFKRLNIIPLKIGHKIFILKTDMTNILEDSSAIINKHDYYSLDEFKQKLSITNNRDAALIEKEHKVLVKKVHGYSKYYKKITVENLKIKQNELMEFYLSFEEAEKIAKSEGFPFHSDYIEKTRLDSLLRPFYKGKSFMYSKKTFFNWLEKRKNENNYFLVSLKSAIETFEYRLKIKNVQVNELGHFTSNTWFQFVSKKLKSTKANSQTINRYIYTYIYCTEYLIKLVQSNKSKEVYSITSKEINQLFKITPKKYSLILYIYLKEVYNKMDFNDIKAFDFKKVNNPANFKVERQKKSIYQFEDYKKIYNYSKDISLHKTRAIKDSIKEISGSEESIKYYSSSWLYVLLHLNNSWRHSDVITIPQVNLSGTKIKDLNWLLENDLDCADIDYIIKQLYRKEFIISKTNVKNHFFCSEELKKPLATAIAICQLRINALSPLRSSIIDFGNKKQNFSNTRHDSYFYYLKDKGIQFHSRKMNRTLLTYIYTVLNETKKGDAALNTVQKMRGHVEQETTNIYVDIPKTEVNKLTKQLFDRGSFGFIYDIFLNILQGEELNREKRTNEIKFIKKYFGNINNIEQISKFLNVVQNDRKSIIDRFISMGLEDTLEFVNKIEKNQLPSKEDNIQCIVSESGCVKKGQSVSCLDCAYSIPNYYSLSSLGSSIQKRLDDYISSKEKRKSYYEQRKKARLLYIQLDLFARAIEKFGVDIYDFIKDSRDEFKEKLGKIPSLENHFNLKKE